MRRSDQKLDERRRPRSGRQQQLPPARRAETDAYRPNRGLDTHELLKHTAFATREASCESHFEKNRPCPSAVYGVRDDYIVLDSWEKVETSRIDRGEYQFNFAIQGVTRDQMIGVTHKLDTVIGLEIKEFCIPLLEYANFDPAELTVRNPSLAILNLAANGALPVDGDATSNAQSQIPFCGRVTVYLKEIGLQSVSGANNRRFHFELAATVVPDVEDRILLTPLEDQSFYLFTDPIQDIHGLTVQMNSPDNPLRFPPDCLYGATASSDAAQLLTFTYADQTNLINLAIGDRIFIRNFTATSASLDVNVLNRYVNNPDGHIIGAGGFAITAPTSSTSGTTVVFRLNPDVSVATWFAANTEIPSAKSIEIRVAKNRIRIPLRIRGVVPRLTNYIAP